MVLNSAVNSFREPGSNILKLFMEYQELWEGDRDQLVDEFINPPADADPPREAPSLSELKAEIQRYVDKLDEIQEIENNFVIGNLQINSANIKTALTVEAKVRPVSTQFLPNMGPNLSSYPKFLGMEACTGQSHEQPVRGQNEHHIRFHR